MSTDEFHGIYSQAVNEALIKIQDSTKQSIRRTRWGVGLGVGFVVLLLFTVAALIDMRLRPLERDFAVQQSVVQAQATQIALLSGRLDDTISQPLPDISVVIDPTALQVPNLRYKVTTYYSGYNLGNGSYLLKMRIDPDPKGQFESFDEAHQFVDQTITTAGQTCVHSYMGTPNNIGTLSMFESYNTQKRVTQDCWDTLTQLTGLPPKDHLPADKIKYLQNNVGVGTNEQDINLFFDDQGYLLGYWQNSALPGPSTKGCLDVSLKAIGWRGQTGYFVVGQHEAGDTLYNEGFAAKGPKIPDLCGIAALRETSQPMWLEVSRNDGVYTLTSPDPAQPLTVVIHTDQTTDPNYPNGWEQGRYLIETVGRSYKATVANHDLVAIDVYLGQGYNIATYFSIENGQIIWYTADTIGWPEVNDVAALVISPWIDGIAPYVRVGNGTYYLSRGNVLKQTPPREWKTT